MRAAASAEQVGGARVSDGFFRTLGVHPVLGRDFRTGEDLPAAPRTVLLSYAAWQKRFGGRQDVLGQTVTLDGNPNVIIGVLPRDFHFAPAEPAEFWTTLHDANDCRGCHALYGIARLKAGVSFSAAVTEITQIAKQLENQYPDSNRGNGATVVLLPYVIIGDVRPILLLLLSGAALLLLIAGVNVTSLLLVRSEGRKREISVRCAVGASRARLFRQFVTEGLVLAVAGGTLGLLFASWATQLCLKLIPADMLAGMPYFPGEDPVGMEIIYNSDSPQPRMQIIGLVDDVKEGPLDVPARAAMYVPLNQQPASHFSAVVRTSQAEESLLPTFTEVIHQLDPGLAISAEKTMLDRIHDSPAAYMRRSSAWLVGTFATVALVLAVVGLYGVISYSVSQRTREIGVRMALGAQSRSVHQLILKEAGRLIVTGISVGLICAVISATLMRSLLFGVDSWDLPTLVAVAATLGLCAFCAAYVPARRAASLDPMEVLRAE